MTFYTLKYIENNQNNNQTILYILMLVAATAMINFAILYVRDRGIIALLFLLLFAAAQYEKYVQINTQKSQATQIIPFN